MCHRFLPEDRFSLLLELIKSDVYLCIETYSGAANWSHVIDDVIGVEIESGEPLSLVIQCGAVTKFNFEILPRIADLVNLLKMNFSPDKFDLSISHSIPGELFDSSLNGYFDLTDDQLGRMIEVVDEYLVAGVL